MSTQHYTTTPEGAVRGNTLREAMEIRRVRGERFSLKESVGIMVPLCTQLASLHAAGATFFLHPSALDHGKAGTELTVESAVAPPTHERDRACLAPEERKGQKGDSRASVFSIGAILYELLTGDCVGPGMKRPTEAVPGLPSNLEVLLGKALVADPKHRPGDLGALAQALHQLCPSGSMPPPAADVSHLDHDADFEVDVSLSMIPPAPSMRPPRVAPVPTPSASRIIGDGPFTVVEAIQAPPPSGPNMADPTARLAALKEELESDPRPRYIVIKDGMDHGPFSAVELLQQIASASFVGSHHVRDTMSNEEKKISEWEQFAQFAEHAKLNRDIKREKKAFEAVVTGEKQRMQWKTLIGVTVLGMIGAAGLAILMRDRLNSKHNEEVHGDKAVNVDVDGGIGSGKDDKKPGGGGGHWTGGAGSFPTVAGGGSCEAAIAKYTEEYTIGGGNGKPDLGAADYGNVLNRGGYLNACGVASNMSVDICVAVQNGHAVGVTVRTNPSSPGVAGCIAGQVRGLGFPSHPRMDVARTSFAAQ